MATAGGLAPPLYMHSSVLGAIYGRLGEGSLESEWEQRVISIFRSQARAPPHLPACPLQASCDGFRPARSCKPSGVLCDSGLWNDSMGPCKAGRVICSGSMRPTASEHGQGYRGEWGAFMHPAIVLLGAMQVGVVKRYNAEDAVEGLLSQVRRDLSLEADAPFTLITPRPGERCARSRARLAAKTGY